MEHDMSNLEFLWRQSFLGKSTYVPNLRAPAAEKGRISASVLVYIRCHPPYSNQENQLTDLRTSSRDTIFCTGKWRCDYDRSIDVMPTAEDGSMETTHNEDGGKKTGLWSRWLLVNALLENLIMMGAPQLFIYLCCAIWTTCLFGRLCYATAGYIIIKLYTIVSVFN